MTRLPARAASNAQHGGPCRNGGARTPNESETTQIDTMRFPNRHAIRDERAQTMTELAIVLPVLCLLLFGVIQFGILWNNYVTLTDAVRAGARKAAVSRHTDPVAAGCAQVRQTAAGLDGTLECSTFVTGDATRPGADVTVTATYPYEIDLVGIVFASGRIESTTTERME